MRGAPFLKSEELYWESLKNYRQLSTKTGLAALEGRIYSVPPVGGRQVGGIGMSADVPQLASDASETPTNLENNRHRLNGKKS
jgi:hypothetical protein